MQYYKTSDGQVFYTENLAHNHARSLKDKSVNPISKEEFENGKKPKTETKVKESSNDTLDYNALKAKAKELGINPNQKKAKLAELIAEAEAKTIIESTEESDTESEDDSETE